MPPVAEATASRVETKPAEDVNKTATPVQVEQQNVDTPPQPLTDKEQWMQAAGIDQSEWYAVDYIISHESSWRPNIYNKEGCVGLAQRCPASVLLAECPDLDPVCQLRHFTRYAVGRYGSWVGAYNTWLAQSWW